MFMFMQSCVQCLDCTTILRGMDGSVNFYRNWTEYTNGFGNAPYGEFFIGLKELHKITSAKPHELQIVLRDWDNNMRYAFYDLFEIGNESEQYILKVLGNYTGDAGDSLDFQKGKQFSTFDRDNDYINGSCAKIHRGAWWYGMCYDRYLP